MIESIIVINRSSIVVFGSMNMDLVARTPKLPVPGETLLGYSFTTTPGGKGANQAVATARLGAATSMVGRVGHDSFGQELLTSLKSVGVDTQAVLVDEACTSGVAMIAVDDRSENHIIVIPGANGRIDETDVERLAQCLANAAVLLLQFEVPIVAVQAAAKAAKQAGVKVILDPAPAIADVPAELYTQIDVITPNAIEAEQLVGFPVNTPEHTAQAARILHQRGIETVVIKLGANGVFCSTGNTSFFTPTFPVQAVDTVAAGDAFNGGFAVALAEGQSLQAAIVWGTAAGALSVTKAGAQSSLPDRSTFDTFLKEHLLSNF
jgi:ribokinase